MPLKSVLMLRAFGILATNDLVECQDIHVFFQFKKHNISPRKDQHVSLGLTTASCATVS